MQYKSQENPKLSLTRKERGQLVFMQRGHNFQERGCKSQCELIHMCGWMDATTPTTKVKLPQVKSRVRERAPPLKRVCTPLLGIGALKESAPPLKREGAPLLEISTK
jgi:hypothetical protein